jgi:hypothetical protein
MGFAPPEHPDCVPVEAEPPGAGGDFFATDLHVEWATPNTIRIAWKKNGSVDDFGRYELRVWPVGRCDDLRVVTAADNPELGVARFPGESYFVEFTNVRDLEEGTNYLLQLLVEDWSGARSATEVLNARTAGATSNELVIVADEPTPGYSIPPSFVFSTRNPFVGTGHYEYRSVCGDTRCFEQLRRQNLGLPTSELSFVDPWSIHYEFAVAVEEAASSSFFSQVRLWFGQDGATGDLLVYYPFSIAADGQYRVYQFPIGALLDTEEEPAAVDLSAGLYEFTVAGEWADGSLVSVDQVRLRW